MGNLKDLTGQKFGRLTVIERGERPIGTKTKGAFWVCRCECGNIKTIRGSDLTRGLTQSCGCLQKERRAEYWTEEKRKETSEKKKKEWKEKDDAEKQKYSEKQKALWDKERREKKSQQMTKQWQDDNFKKRVKETSSETFKKLWQDDDFRKRNIESTSRRQKELWKDEEYRIHMSECTKQQWKENEEYKEIMEKTNEQTKEKLKELWKDEEYRRQHIDRMKQQTKDKNPNWKGGKTDITNYLRGFTKEWDKQVRDFYNKKCVVTGQKCTYDNSTVHHLKSFHGIVQEAFEINNIEIKDKIKDYTEDELELLSKYVLLYHNDTNNGVLITKEVHQMFHKTYGYKNNTPEQFEEFKERYLNGEF